MTFSDFLYTLIIGPLEALFEIIYHISYSVLQTPGGAIICLSVVMNLLLMPLYNRTDAIQQEAIDTDKALHHWSRHIKKTFHGDERFMILQTYYRQNNYKPTDVLKGISPLLLEIPFFMAAYHFLSHLQLLSGTPFGPIRDLSSPDGLLVFGSFAVNLLPVLMTAINLISSAIYTKGAPAKTKIQLYLMAAVFLVLLYTSPSGLVLYWTLNNLFSLVKNIIMRQKHRKLIASGLFSGLSLLVLGYFALHHNRFSVAGLTAAFLAAVCMNLPLFLCLRKKKALPKFRFFPDGEPNFRLYCTGCVFMTLLTGLTIPSALLAASPEEFIFQNAGNPIFYILSALLLAAGLFLLWGIVFYRLANPAWKKRMELALWLLCAASAVNYMFFGKGYGNLSNDLIFDNPVHVTVQDTAINLAVLAAVLTAGYLLWRKREKIAQLVCLAGVLAISVMSVWNVAFSEKIILPKMEQVSVSVSQDKKIIPISKKGKNVVVFMMDRAINGYLPYIFHEKPELVSQFDGFTYYPNTLSFGPYTNFGLPAAFGGYEYTPEEMNRRDQELLADKHNEAMKVIPPTSGL